MGGEEPKLPAVRSIAWLGDVRCMCVRSDELVKTLCRRNERRQIVIRELADVGMPVDDSPRERMVNALELCECSALLGSEKGRHLGLGNAPKQVFQTMKARRLRKAFH